MPRPPDMNATFTPVPGATPTLDIDIADLRRLTALVKTHYGMDFGDYAMSSFRRRVSRIIELERLGGVEVLIRKLETTPAYFHTFVSEITVNVTEMFRDPSFWRVLRDEVIPSVLLNQDKINIWHAGCSSGEEVFSMAILLEEMGLLDRARIFATDLDREIIQRARSGQYSLKNMELNSKNYLRFQGARTLEDYYTVRNQTAVLRPDLLRTVMFREHDLVAGEAFSKFELILCRNVMIYFNQQLQNQVLKLFHGSLHKFGYLAIGSKESLIWCDYANRFLAVNNEEKIYKKHRD